MIFLKSIIKDLIKLLMRVQFIYTGIRRTPTTTGRNRRTPEVALELSIIALQKSQVTTETFVLKVAHSRRINTPRWTELCPYPTSPIKLPQVIGHYSFTLVLGS